MEEVEGFETIGLYAWRVLVAANKSRKKGETRDHVAMVGQGNSSPAFLAREQRENHSAQSE